MTSSVDGALLQRNKRGATVAVVHMKKLLRFRNWLCSPLLRLPTETLVRILSFVMVKLDFLPNRPWRPIHLICHRIRRIMCSTAELWWRVDCAYARAAHLVFVRSRGDPQVIVSDLRSMDEERLVTIEKTVDSWRDEHRFRGQRLHTLEFYGSPSNFSHFSWVLERPLPRLRSLRINIIDSIEEHEMLSSWPPVTLEFPVNVTMPLQVLNLRGVVLSWSSHSHLFSRLRELRLSFRDCDGMVMISEDELFDISGASPQLEHLSLLRVGHEVPVRDGRPLPGIHGPPRNRIPSDPLVYSLGRGTRSHRPPLPQ